MSTLDHHRTSTEMAADSYHEAEVRAFGGGLFSTAMDSVVIRSRFRRQGLVLFGITSSLRRRKRFCADVNTPGIVVSIEIGRAQVCERVNCPLRVNAGHRREDTAVAHAQISDATHAKIGADDADRRVAADGVAALRMRR